MQRSTVSRIRRFYQTSLKEITKGLLPTVTELFITAKHRLGTPTAAAQQASTSGRPVLLNVNFNAGHGGDVSGKYSARKEQARSLAFILWQCGFETANKYETPPLAYPDHLQELVRNRLLSSQASDLSTLTFS